MRHCLAVQSKQWPPGHGNWRQESVPLGEHHSQCHQVDGQYPKQKEMGLAGGCCFGLQLQDEGSWPWGQNSKKLRNEQKNPEMAHKAGISFWEHGHDECLSVVETKPTDDGHKCDHAGEAKCKNSAFDDEFEPAESRRFLVNHYFGPGGRREPWLHFQQPSPPHAHLTPRALLQWLPLLQGDHAQEGGSRSTVFAWNATKSQKT